MLLKEITQEIDNFFDKDDDLLKEGDDLEFFEDLLSKYQLSDDLKKSHEIYIFQLAALNDRLNIINHFFNKQIDDANKKALINSKDERDGLTPLELAVNVSAIEVVEFLLNNGAEIDTYNYGRSPFETAILGNNADIVELFFEKSDKNKLSVYKTFWWMSVFFRNINNEMLKLILDNQIKIDHTDASGETILSTLILWEKFLMAEFILNHSASDNIDKHKALIYAAEFGQVNLVKLLFEKGALDRDNLVLKMVAILGHADVLAVILDNHLLATDKAKISVNAEILDAIKKDHQSVIEVFFKYGIEMDLQSSKLSSNTAIKDLIEQFGDPLMVAQRDENLKKMIAELPAGKVSNAQANQSSRISTANLCQ